MTSLAGLAIFLLLGSVCMPAQGETRRVIAKPTPDNKKTSAGQASVLPQPDRETLKLLSDAKHLIEKERFGEAVRILGDILRSPDDSFFPTKTPPKGGSSQIRGLHDKTERILGSLPYRAIELYELQFGAQARQLLDKAMREGDTRSPTDISRRFFYTAAGAEATWLSGLTSMDEGRWRAAVLAFERFKKTPAVSNGYEPLVSILKAICMEQAGDHESAVKTWGTLRKRTPRASIQVAGKAIPLFIDSEETFEQFLIRTDLVELGTSGKLLTTVATNQTLPFGTPERNASVDAGIPLLKRAWRARITDRPLVEAIIQKQREAHIDNSKLAIPRFYPLVVDGVLFSRTLRTLVAIDTTTGKRLWETGLEKTSQAAKASLTMNRNPTTFLKSLAKQILSNSIFGQLSSDTRYIYAIEDLDLSDVSQSGGGILLQPLGGMPKSQVQGQSNTLVAFDTKTGQRRWARSTGANDAPLFFLGPPLPLDGLLYALAKGQGEIHLVVISATSGDLDWSQRIAVNEQSTSHYGQQVTEALMPAVLDGVMICPTGTGAIIALDPTTRALLWAHCYEQLGRNQHRRFFINGVPRGQNQNRIGEELMLHGSYVFSAPTDSRYLYCLDLRTGKEIWKKDFADGAFLGGVHGDQLLVVGGKNFRTLKVKDGQEIAKCDFVKSPGQEEDNILITGRGFRNEGVYYAPTSSNNIVAFDIAQGKIVQQTRTREPIILGNLVAIDDRIFSQSLDGLDAFHQLKSIRAKTEKQLLENPNNLVAIAMQGELLLAEEKLDEAIEKFRHVHRASPTPMSGDRLFDAFCIGLEETYPQYRDALPEIESLLRTVPQKNEYWYHIVRGEIAENNLDAATDACFHLAELAGKSQLMLSMGRYHTVRQDRFVQAQLATIYENSDAESQEKLGQKILAQLESAIQSNEQLTISGAWNCYASLPPVVKHYDQITEQLWETDPVFAELLLEKTTRFGGPREAATAMVHWAELLRKAGRMDDAAACYRAAIQRWKKVPLLATSPQANPTQTAYAKVSAMRLDDPVRSRLESHRAWPQGHEVGKPEKAGQTVGRSSIYMQTCLPPVGLPSPIFQNKQLLYTGQQIELRDQYNRKIWTLSLVDEDDQNSGHYYGHSKLRCSTVGHMIFLESQNRIVAINAWNPKQPKIAWQSERGTSVNVPGVPTVNSSFSQTYLQGFTQGMYSNNRRTLGMPGLDFGFQLLTLSGTELIALDPFDGTPLWKQRKMPNQIDFNSDGTTLFVSQPNQRSKSGIEMKLTDGSRVVPTESKSSRKASPPTKGGNNNKAKNAPKGGGKEDKKREEMARKAGELAARLFMKSALRSSKSLQKVLSLGRNTFAFKRVSRTFSFSLIDSLSQKPLWKPKTYDYQSRWGLLGQDYVGIIDRKGNFELFRIADGKTLFKRRLKMDGSLQGIFLQSMGDRVGVIVSTQPESKDQSINISHIPITNYLYQGRIYTFYWDGRPAMTKQTDGVLIKRQGLLIDPPERLPVITLMSQHYNDKNTEKPWSSKLQVLDSRSGEEILSKEVTESIQSFKLTGNPEEKTVQYQLNDQKYTIEFK